MSSAGMGDSDDKADASSDDAEDMSDEKDEEEAFVRGYNNQDIDVNEGDALVWDAAAFIKAPAVMLCLLMNHVPLHLASGKEKCAFYLLHIFYVNHE